MSNFLLKTNNKKLSARAKSILVIEEILKGQSLSSLLDDVLLSVDVSDRGFVHELTLGCLRQWYALSRISEGLLDRQPSDRGLLVAIHVGLYQLFYMKTPDYAAINDTVAAVKELGKDYGAGLVNAVLRRVQKSLAKLNKKVQKNHSLPNWLAKQLKQDWSQVYDELGSALRHSAPIFLRVNESLISQDDYRIKLQEAGIDYQMVDLGVRNYQAISLQEAVRISDLPGFKDGWVSVQDAHAQLAAYILKAYLPSDQLLRVLDLCAAPGGKTTHLLEQFHMKHLTALDSEATRLSRVSQNLARLGYNDRVELVCADGRTWQADQPYDVVLLDAPCTATGVLRRHPDIALLRQESDVVNTVQLQAEILKNAWQQLKSGGYLLYATCSLLKVENESQILKFLSQQSDAQIVDFQLDLPGQFRQAVGYQCLPLDPQGGDGFYYALLKKV